MLLWDLYLWTGFSQERYELEGNPEKKCHDKPFQVTNLYGTCMC